MKISRKKIYIIVVIIAVLVVTFFWGGGFAKSNPSADFKSKTDIQVSQNLEKEDSVKTDKESTNTTGEALETEKNKEVKQAVVEDDVEANVKVNKNDIKYSETKGMEINPSTGKDKYQTDPVPEGKPVPVEPGSVKIGNNAKTCTMSIQCKTILDNIDSLNKEKIELVPEDGIIMSPTTVTFYEGESVFNLLQRETKKNKIHMEFSNTPMYNSAYIEGIHNLYEYDCGELSGWMYKVNGWFPNYGCSRYLINQGDNIEWVYTCDLGRDIGGGFDEK